jgi:ABC-type phosphate transport system auxiliary subunit
MDGERMHEEIVELLSLPNSGLGAPTLARIEDTLTEGYAEALALEAERLRLERRLGEVALGADPADADGLAAELAEISQRIRRADGRLAHLRALLRSLRERAREARAAPA